MEGPRGLRPDELSSLRELTGRVFRPSLVDEYPQLFHEGNFENLRVCVDEGRCVSHVGMTTRRASFFGCSVQVGCIGAVATHPDYRGQGLASRCFDDAAKKAFTDGTDLLLVSGDRALYRRAGCLRAPCGENFTLTAEAARALLPGALVTVETMTDADLPLVRACYQNEPVRFLRPAEDYDRAIGCGVVMNRPSDFLVVRGENGDLRAYLIVGQRDGKGRARIAEFAGDRHALLAALPTVLRHCNASALGWQVPGHDVLFRALCVGAGLTGGPAAFPGTIKLIHFAQLMERLRPRWEELLGTNRAACLSFRQQNDTFAIRFGDDELAADRDTMTRLLLGAPDSEQQGKIERDRKLTQILEVILPLPCLWYGLNYA